MQPALTEGDSVQVCASTVSMGRVVADSLKVERGDLVVFQFGFRQLRGESPIVKRVVGVPGDSLGARFGREVPAFERRAVVPEGSFYVHGDNPTGRYDSRTFGLVSRGQVLGKVVPAP